MGRFPDSETIVASLTDKKCKPCEGGAEPLSGDRAAQLKGELHGDWHLHSDGLQIERVFEFPVFSRTIAFVNAVAWVATIEGHHPDLEVSYGRCAVRYTTHAIGGLSENDFICAAKIDALAADAQGT